MYRHVRLDKNEVFYIGIGTKDSRDYRMHTSEYNRAFSKKNRSKYWKNIVNKANYKVEILLESNDYGFIKQKEIEFIKLYGRRDLGLGDLVNNTNGGDGTKGHIRTKETTEKFKLSIAKSFTKERLQQCSENAKGNKNMVGRTHSEESKLKMSNSSKTKRKVTQYTLDGEFVKIHESIKSVEKDGFCSENVNCCCTGVRKTHKKFKWEYYEH